MRGRVGGSGGARATGAAVAEGVGPNVAQAVERGALEGSTWGPGTLRCPFSRRSTSSTLSAGSHDWKHKYHINITITPTLLLKCLNNVLIWILIGATRKCRTTYLTTQQP